MSEFKQGRREFLKTIGLGTAVLTVPGLIQSCLNNNSGESNLPNIIFIMTDDMGYGDSTCYNPDSLIPTPNIDKLATQGIRFTDAHTPSAVCTPTRYGVMTGRYCWRSRLKRGVFGGLPHDGSSFLKQYGYSTACIGKWHLGLKWTLKEGIKPGEQEQMTVDFSGPISDDPNKLGFDYFLGTAGCTTDDPPLCFIENEHTIGIPNILSPEDPADEDRDLLMVPGWRHEDADIEFTNKTIEFIENHIKSKPDNPFFVYLPLSVPEIDQKKAEGFWREVVALDSSDQEALKDLAYLLIEKEINVNEGVMFAERASEIDSLDYRIMDTLGWGYYKQEKYELAAKILEKAESRTAKYNRLIREHLEKAQSTLQNAN